MMIVEVVTMVIKVHRAPSQRKMVKQRIQDQVVCQLAVKVISLIFIIRRFVFDACACSQSKVVRFSDVDTPNIETPEEDPVDVQIDRGYIDDGVCCSPVTISSHLKHFHFHKRGT